MAETDEFVKTPKIVNFVLIPGLVLQAVSELVLFVTLTAFAVDLSAFLDPNYIPENLASALYALSTLISIVLGILNFVLFLFWVYRMSSNINELAEPEPVYGPGWAVGWWFIPFANLWKPFDVVRELYNASKEPNGWQGLKTPPLLIAWWAVTLIVVIPAVVIRIAESSEGSIGPATAYAVLYGLGTIRLALLVTIILRINGFQKTAGRRSGIEQVF